MAKLTNQQHEIPSFIKRKYMPPKNPIPKPIDRGLTYKQLLEVINPKGPCQTRDTLRAIAELQGVPFEGIENTNVDWTALSKLMDYWRYRIVWWGGSILTDGEIAYMTWDCLHTWGARNSTEMTPERANRILSFIQGCKDSAARRAQARRRNNKTEAVQTA